MTKWQKLIVLGAFGIAISAIVSSAAERSSLVLVTKIVDGDTIDVQGIGRVRLLGIDAPEMGSGLDTPAPFATEARARLSSLVQNRWVVLEYESRARDTYNRRLAYVLINGGSCVNTTMVEDGLARVSARESLSRLSELKRAEAEAQTLRRGMWGAQPSRPLPRYVTPRRDKKSSARKPPRTPRTSR